MSELDLEAHSVVKESVRSTTFMGGKPKLPLTPKHPERVCWGCDKYCGADDLRCGNGTVRTQHPAELFGDDWFEWELETRVGKNGGEGGI